VLRLRAQRRTVDADAGALDGREDRQQGHLEIAVYRFELVGHEQRRQTVRELPRQVGAFPGEVQHRFRRQTRERCRLRTASADVFLGDRLVAEMFERRFLERMARARRVEQVARQHRVEGKTLQRDATAREHHDIELQIVTNLADLRILEQRL